MLVPEAAEIAGPFGNQASAESNFFTAGTIRIDGLRLALVGDVDTRLFRILDAFQAPALTQLKQFAAKDE